MALRYRFRVAVVVAVVVAVAWAATMAGLPGTHAVWTGSTAATDTVSTKKVFSTTLSDNFMDWIDASSGTAGAVQQSRSAYLDGVTTNTNNVLSPTFNTAYYEEMDYTGQDLPPSVAVSNVQLTFAYAVPVAAENACFYLSAIRFSDNTDLQDHGSPASTLGCVTTTTPVTFTIPLPEITNTDTLKDSFGIRVYATNSASDKIQIDTAQVSGSLMYNNGTQSYNTFTMYEFQRQSHEPAGNATPTWALGRIDGPGAVGITALGASGFPISASYTNTDYLEFDQTPSLTFVPPGATITSSSIALTFYETLAAGNVLCPDMMLYLSGTLTATATASGANCSSSTTAETTWTVDTTAIITTPAQADNTMLRVSAINSTSAAQLRVDYVKLTVTYSLS